MSKPESLPHLSSKELESMVISTDKVVSMIEHLIKGTAESRTWNAPKMVITPPDDRYMMATLSASDDPPYMAVKSLVLNPKNRERGIREISLAQKHTENADIDELLPAARPIPLGKPRPIDMPRSQGEQSGTNRD